MDSIAPGAAPAPRRPERRLGLVEAIRDSAPSLADRVPGAPGLRVRIIPAKFNSQLAHKNAKLTLLR